VCVCVCTEALEEDDDVPFSDKKKSKIKLPFSTKKIMKSVGLKDKEKDKSSPAASVEAPSQQQVTSSSSSSSSFAREQHVPSAEIQAKMQDSDEWKAFQAMQDRISQVVSRTSEKVSQMEQGFESELTKLTATGQSVTSPWTLTNDVSSSPTAGDRDDQKNLSWVGFEDTFAATADDDQQEVESTQTQVDSSQQVVDSESEQVSQLVNDSSSPPPDKDVISRHSADTRDTPPAAETVAEAVSDVAMVINSSQVAEEATGAEHQDTTTTTPDNDAVTETTAQDTDTADPFDVSNVVTAMTSGKPIFEALPSDGRRSSGAGGKQQMTADERRERDRQITAALIGADDNEAAGARTRPRPRPQAAVKSANPFKISLAATSIEPADEIDDSYDVDEDNYAQTSVTMTTFSAANPFARTDFDETHVDSGVWDPFSGDDVATFTANFELDNDEHADVTNFQLTNKDSRSPSRSSLEDQPDEPLEPLDPFYPAWDGKTGWTMFLRTPLRKKLTQNRAWKAVFVRLCNEQDATRLRVFTSDSETTCLHEMTIGPTFAVRQLQLQQFDQYTKCHTVKLQHVFYVEKLALKSDRIAPTLRDVTKVRDLKGLKDLVHKPKTTMLLSHSPQATESLKFGTLDLVAYKQFIRAVEDVMFVQKAAQRGKMATSYTKDEISVDLVDEYYADIDYEGHICYHKARVRLFCLAFLTGNPVVEIGINDKKRRGNEVVGRADIIPIKTEDWIKYEDVELHDIIDRDEYDKCRLIKFRCPDASRFEAMRFRVRPRPNVELPLQIGVQMSVVDRRIEIRADVMIPGYYSTSRRASQVACENIQIRFPIPESLVYMFRVEKRFRYGSVHSSRKKPGRIKGLERLTMFATGANSGGGGGGGSSGGTAVPGSTPIVLQASSGLAKYEHLYRAVVWRISRLPERNQGLFTHCLSVCVSVCVCVCVCVLYMQSRVAVTRKQCLTVLTL